jgi:hypothetical protein
VTRKPILTVVAWSAGAVSLAAFAAAWVLAARGGDLSDIAAEFGPDRFMIAYTVAGAFLAARRRSNPVGWLLLGIGLVEAVRGLAGEYVRHSLAGSPHGAPPGGAIWAAWFVNWSFVVLFPTGLLTFMLLLFPDGRPLTRRWRAVGWGAAGLTVVFLAITWLDPGPITLGGGLPGVPNPTGVRGWFRLENSAPGQVLWVLSWAAVLLAAVSVALRYRRSAGEERLQLKWFVYAVAVSVGLTLLLVPASAAGGPGQAAYDVSIVAGFGLAMPVAIGVAVLKYRLYSIDRIISRTVSYVLVTGLVVGVYLGCIALLSQVRPVRGSVGVAASVLVAAALFNPLRRRVQAVVDRRFDRAGYDAAQVVTGFSERLREQVNLDVLGADLTGVVQHVLAPEHVSLWLRDQPDGQERAGADS